MIQAKRLKLLSAPGTKVRIIGNHPWNGYLGKVRDVIYPGGVLMIRVDLEDGKHCAGCYPLNLRIIR